jgi:hypothetical protein
MKIADEIPTMKLEFQANFEYLLQIILAFRYGFIIARRVSRCSFREVDFDATTRLVSTCRYPGAFGRLFPTQ